MPELHSTDCNGGRWYHWGGKFRRVPRDWSFPHMTLRNAFHRYFLPDTKNKICPLRYLHTCDVANLKNGKRILSSLHILFKFIINELKNKNKFYDNPTDQQLDTMYKVGSGCILSFSKNNRAESFSWRTHYKNLEMFRRNNKN